MHVGAIKHLGEGFDAITVESDDGYVFRIPKDGTRSDALRREARLMPGLAYLLPVRIPVPERVAGPTDSLPFGASCYRKVPGVPLTPHRLASGDRPALAGQIARVLRALHSFPASEARRIGLPGPLTAAARQRLRDQTLSALECALSADEIVMIEEWWSETLSDAELDDFTPVLAHGDLWYDHILVDEDSAKITGITDFGSVHLGDPAHGDFAPLRYLGPAFTLEVIRHYYSPASPPASLLRRTDRYWGLREFWGVEYANRTANRAEFEESIRKLRSGSILLPRGHPPLAEMAMAV
jgi:aminoglycoside 2''-phosphotransferase